MSNQALNGDSTVKFYFLGLLIYCSIVCLRASSPVSTVAPTAPPPVNSWFKKFGASLHRRNKKLEAKPIAVAEDVSVVQCLGLCLQRQTGGKAKICHSFNYKNRICYMLNTFLCDGERDLADAPGYSYFDISDDFKKESDYIKSKQCEYKGKCSNKCLKFKLFKTPMSWDEANAACQVEEAFLAMPRIPRDHETLITLMKKYNMLQSWIGIRKRDGVFYYNNGDVLGNYTEWGPDQPNDSGGTQQCVQMMNEMDYMWNDFDCARPVGYVCQYVW